MRSPDSKFKLLKRGFKENLVLVPGWAMDHRIFSTLDLPYNYILALDLDPFYFRDDLSGFLNKWSLDRVSLLGWSSGGFLAADFAARNPEKIDVLILVSIRKKFPGPSLEKIKQYLNENKKAYLYKFYHECFSETEKKEYSWFKTAFQKNYLKENKLESLIDGLDYLAEARIATESLKGLKDLWIFHGQKDKIAPLEEAREIKSGLPQARFVWFPESGHLPFLRQDFRRKLARGASNG